MLCVSIAKKSAVSGSDLDIIIILDDVSVNWDQEMIAWYREELDKIIRLNPYRVNLHINTIKLSTWWADLLRGDPVIINVIRDGQALIDFGGFFEPLKFLLVQVRIKSTPESMYSLLLWVPEHITMSNIAELIAAYADSAAIDRAIEALQSIRTTQGKQHVAEQSNTSPPKTGPRNNPTPGAKPIRSNAPRSQGAKPAR